LKEWKISLSFAGAGMFLIMYGNVFNTKP